MIKKFSIVFILLLFVPFAKATHLIGGSMSYQYLGKNSRGMFNYKLTLNIYRDCQQSEVPFDPTIQIGIYHNNSTLSRHKKASIKLISKKIVSPPGNTTCPFKPSVCIEEGFYEGIIEVDPSTIGYHLTFVRCCRNIQNNLSIGGGGGMPDQGQTYYCFIPPTDIRNSSPVFKGVPSPYMCANDTTSFLNTAVDPDGDSLVYYFAKPFQGGSPTGAGSEPDPPPTLDLPIVTVDYKNGFNENQPFGSTGYSSIDRFNGLTNYFTRVTGNYVVAIEVAEYRNGVLLSVVRLDLQIIFIDCPPNQKPTISSDKGKNFTIEAGSKLCFNVISTDADNHNLKLTPIGDIFTGANGWKGPKATLSAKTGKGSITSEFCWQTSCDQANTKPYQFAVKVEDDGCPAKFNAANFNITVTPFISNVTITGRNSPCRNSIEEYTAANFATKSSLFWEAINGTIISGQGSPKVKIKWTGLTSGKVRLLETSQYGCKGIFKELDVSIFDSPPLPNLSGLDTVCLNSNGVVYAISNFSAGISSTWIVNVGTILVNNSNTVSILWPVLGDQIIKVYTTDIRHGCNSDTAYKKVNVRKPIPIILGTKSVCPNAKGIEYKVTGNSKSTFAWTITGGVIISASNTDKIIVNWGNQGIGIVSVTETDRFGCQSDPISLSVNKSYVLDQEFAKGKLSVCEFEKAVPYYIYPSNGTNFIWKVTGGAILPPGTTETIKVDWGKAGPGLVTITRTAYDSVNNRACASLPANINVVINPTPNANKLIGDFDICQLPDSVTYSLPGFAGSSYFWKINGNSANISGQGSRAIRVAFNTPGNYKIEVIELSKDSCFGILVDSTVVVNPKPSANFIIGPITVCDPNFSNLNYSIQGLNNSKYNWTINNGTIISGAGTNNIFVNWLDLDPAWIKVIETSEFGCVGDSIFQEITLDKLQIELYVVSVGTPDNRMEIDWKTLNSRPFMRNFEIQKRITGILAWNTFASITDFNSYIEQPLNTDSNAFDYQIKVKDLCGVEKISNVHTNVWLFGSKTEDPYEINIEFSPYLGWKNGVSKYLVYRMVSGMGGYQLYDSFTQPKQAFYKNGLEGYLQCYRVLSFEDGGNNQKSWSNEICFNFSPTIYVPNAFTPNDDGINDKFIIKSGAIKTYNLQIFDRWGERLWQTNNPNEHWDGNYQSKQAQMDVYVYAITLTDFRDKAYHLNGTVHVIR